MMIVMIYVEFIAVFGKDHTTKLLDMVYQRSKSNCP